MHPLQDPRTKLAEATAALRNLSTVQPQGQTPETIAQLTLELHQMRDLLDGLCADITAEATAAAVPVRDNLKRISDWVALHTPAATATVARDNRIGEWVRRYPTLRQASRTGDMNRERLLAIKKCENHRTRDAFARDQAIFAFMAKELGWKDFVHALGYWMMLHDPDGDKPKEQHNDRKASTAKDSEGCVHGSFTLDPTAGQAVQTAIKQQVQRLRADDDRTGNKRSWSQLTADAITTLIQRGAVRDDGTLPAPLVHIVLGYRTARELCLRFDPQPGDPEPTPGPIPVDPADPDWRCELIDGTPIHPHDAYKHLGNACIRRIIVDPSNKVSCFGPERVHNLSAVIRPQGTFGASKLLQLMTNTTSVSLGSNARTYPQHLAQAAMIAGRARCTTRGCDAQAHWLQTDHRHPHSRGGRTHLDNAQLLCAHDNGKKSNHLPPPLRPARTQRLQFSQRAPTWPIPARK